MFVYGFRSIILASTDMNSKQLQWREILQQWNVNFGVYVDGFSGNNITFCGPNFTSGRPLERSSFNLIHYN